MSQQISWVGKTLGGRYKIEDRLGQGGMSAVYKATDPNLRRVVAVKMIHPHLSDNPDFVKRFEEEAASVAQLSHPNIIQVYDFNHDNDTYYMVLEFVPGETLQDRLRRLNEKNRQMPIAEAINCITNIGDAVQYAHERGMIHRDIKPANIMLDVYGKAILMDFGIAKILGGQLHTATGAVVGTAMYMSPEQITGEKVDERSDIYSMGVTLFEALSGRPPFEADSAMTLMMMHINDPVPNLRELNPGVPEPLVAAVERMLEKKRDRRYSSAAQMSADLRRILAQIEGKQAEPGPVAAAESGATVIDDGRNFAGAAAAAMAANNDASPSTEVEQGPVRAAPPPAGAAGSNPQGSVRTIAQPSGGTEPYSQRGPRSTPPPGGTGQNPQAGYGSTPPPGGVPVYQTPPPVYSQPKQGSSLKVPLLIAGGVGLVLLCGLVGLYFIGRNLLSGVAGLEATPTEEQRVVFTPTLELLVGASEPTDTPEPVNTATNAPTATPAPPTNTPAPVYSPTPTVPSDRPYVRINDITIADGHYVVEYETFQYTEQLPGMHVHFFFDSVPPEHAGVPGNGPWILYGGPRPFTQYTVSDKPYNATQMCALVANTNHSIQPDSGTCFLLPAN